MTKPGSQRNPTIESLKDRISRDPLSRAFLQLAEEYRKEGRYQEAIDVCQDGLQRHPTYHTARISLGRTYMECGDLENARRTFVEVLELQPENHLAAKLLAEIQKKLGDPAGAAATYRSILSYYPNDREVATLLEETLRRGSTSAPPAAPAPAVAAASRQAPATPAPPASPLPVPSRGPADRPADPAPDFRPEDFGPSVATPVKESWISPPVSAPPPRSEPPSDPIGDVPDDDAMQTNTLAELYLRQGLVDRAIEVYRGMLRVDPGNQKAARRLEELAPAGGSFPVRAVEPAEPTRTPAIPLVPSVPADGEIRRDTVRRLERWLVNFSGAAAKGAPLR